jgi:hypothetical protein
MERRELLALAGLAALAPSAASARSARSVTAAQAIAVAMRKPELRPYRAQIEAAMACLDLFMKGFNARDVALYDQAFNFPSVRLASNILRIINKGDQKPSLFDTLQNTGWDHSAWRRREVIHAGADKVHIDTNFARYRKDGSLLGGYDSMYVVNNEGGHWGVKIRSSFAP